MSHEANHKLTAGLKTRRYVVKQVVVEPHDTPIKYQMKNKARRKRRIHRPERTAALVDRVT